MKRAQTSRRGARRSERRPAPRRISLPSAPLPSQSLPLLLLVLSFAAFAMFTVPAFGQGCAQCLDSTQATPPAVQAAYRHAIFLLGGVGAAVFAGGTLLLRRNR